MKLTKYIPAQAVALLAAGFAVLTSEQPAGGAENIYHRFDDASLATFSRWWGSAVQTYEFDASKDAGGSASLREWLAAAGCLLLAAPDADALDSINTLRDLDNLAARERARR